MTKPALKLVIVRDGKSALRIIRLTRFKTVLIIAFSVIITGMITFAGSRFLANKLTQVAMTDVLDENRELHRQLDGITQRLIEIDDRLEFLYSEDDKLRIMADIPKIDEDVRKVGIGGAVIPEFSITHENKAVSRLIFDLDKIEREIKLQLTSFVEIKKQFREKSDLILHTPSIRPVEGGYISSKFGIRNDPFTGRKTHHNGLDFFVERGTPIFAAANGKVIFAKRTPGLGKLVIIDHGYGFRTAYGHMDKILVNKGQTVERWQKLGEVGSTGRSTAPHLHYEVHIERKAVDPMDYLFNDFTVMNIK